MTLDVVFLGSSQSAFSARHFNALLAAPCNLLAVVDVPPANRDSTNPLPEGLPRFSDVARQRGLPIFEATNTKDPDFLDQLRALQPDLFIAAGYALILKPETLAIPRLMAVNFHASLLPYYRGKHPVFRTLRGGERWAGLTVHVMDPGIDTGDIIYHDR